MKNQNKLEIIGFIILAIGGVLFLIDNFLNLEFLDPILEFREIILYFGLAIWALGLMQNEEKEIAGYVLGGINPKEKVGWILALATEKRFRKQGIGLKLVSAVIKKINELDISSIILTTEPDSPAVDFYKRIGFEIIKNDSNYYGDNSQRVLMELKQKPNKGTFDINLQNE